jgi:uncharacterized protein YdhG (YjbR/CyaY superfamily)
MAAKPKSIDEYLAAVTADQRAALEKLRKAIRAAAPRAQECISYGLAAFRLDGKPLVAFGATASHCAFYPMSSTTIEAHQDELMDYDTSKGTIRFPAAKPLPVALVRKLVKARIAENAGSRVKTKESLRSKKSARGKGAVEEAKAVDEFLRKLDHPLKPVLEAVRKVILSVNPEVREGIKWNAPSFHFKDYFATTGLRSPDFVHVILHRGAKVKDNSTNGMRIADPASLLEWHAKDRCSAKFYDMKDFKSKVAAFQDIVNQWIRQM